MLMSAAEGEITIMARISALAWQDERSVSRDEVLYRARATAPGSRLIKLVIVNISAMGLMARCDDGPSEGERITIALPVVGMIDADVRWALGGRIGCELAAPIGLADYYQLLARMIEGGGASDGDHRQNGANPPTQHKFLAINRAA